MPPCHASSPLAFDLDGTLLAARWDTNYNDPDALARLAPIPAAVERLRALLRQGIPILIVTGRTQAVRVTTEQQVKDLLGELVPIVFQDAWSGGRALITYKADALRVHRARLYVGDTIHDAHAAYLAGVPFMPAQAFADGNTPPAPWATLAGLSSLDPDSTPEAATP